MQEIKNELRKSARKKRKAITDKEAVDTKIAENLFNLDEYRKAKTLLIYVSLDEEIRTDEIINNALCSGKTVAVPCCKDEKGNMDFYIINSLDSLKIGSFNVREPDIKKCRKLSDYSNSIIIVPGMAFDKSGFRLGYGKGYYDRFLSNFNGFSIGLCYDELIFSQLPVDSFDKSVSLVITQNSLIKCNGGGRNG